MVVNAPGTVIPFIRFKDRLDALNAYNLIFMAHAEGHTGDLDVEINGEIHRFTYDVWQAVGGSLDKWYEKYLFHVRLPDQQEN